MTEDLTALSQDEFYDLVDKTNAEWDRTYRNRADDALQVAWAVDCGEPKAVEYWMARFRKRDAEHKQSEAATEALTAEMARRADQ